jgi:4-hydroxybenzoate polyprenyltransferase
VSIGLGLAMTAIQFGIGAINDVVDAPRDRGRPDKPIPSGLVPGRQAVGVGVGCLAMGLGLSAFGGPAVLGVAALGAAIGVGYDLWLKGTPWAPLAYAAGLPLLPVYAWLGATGDVPPVAAVLVPVAALAGVALAIGNSLIDAPRDAAAEVRTPAVVLGPERAWRLTAILTGAVVGLALATLAVVAAGLTTLAGIGLDPAALGVGDLGLMTAVAVCGGSIALVVGVGILRSRQADRRERGWEGMALGVAALALGWLMAVAPP